MLTLEQLLFRGESESLDFKRAQYPFLAGDDAQKGELLKDILAMANAWRSESAFILIGVEDVAGSTQVVGIPAAHHFDDATLQQFVTSKTQRPLKFSYYSAEVSGRSVGVIEIPVQPRPTFLRQNFGRLKANAVYLRRGSSTVEALPDEIAQMGAADVALKGSDLQVRFAKPGGRQVGTTEFKFESQLLRVKEESAIPDYTEAEPAGFYVPTIMSDQTNRDYYRQLVHLAQQVNLLRHTAVTLTNAGSLAAKEVRVEFALSDPKREWEFCEESDYETDLPRRRLDQYGINLPKKALRAVNRHNEPDCEIRYLEGVWHLNFDFGYLQPGRTLWPSLAFYVGARQTGSIQLDGRIMADGLATAARCVLQLTAEVTEGRTTLRKIVQRLEKSARAEDEED